MTRSASRSLPISSRMRPHQRLALSDPAPSDAVGSSPHPQSELPNPVASPSLSAIRPRAFRLFFSREAGRDRPTRRDDRSGRYYTVPDDPLRTAAPETRCEVAASTPSAAQGVRECLSKRTADALMGRAPALRLHLRAPADVRRRRPQLCKATAWTRSTEGPRVQFPLPPPGEFRVSIPLCQRLRRNVLKAAGRTSCPALKRSRPGKRCAMGGVAVLSRDAPLRPLAAPTNAMMGTGRSRRGTPASASTTCRPPRRSHFRRWRACAR